MRYLESNYPKFVSRSWGAEVYCELNCTEVNVGEFISMLRDVQGLENYSLFDDEIYSQVERELQLEYFADALNLDAAHYYNNESASKILDECLESTGDYMFGSLDGSEWFISMDDWNEFKSWARANTAIEFKDGE